MADRRYALLGHTHAGLGASTAWGSITGTLADQTDLQAALDLKAPLASPTFTGTVDVSAATLTGLSSDDLSDVASIAMLDENETVTGAWNFSGQPTFYSGGTSGNIKIGRDSAQYYEIQVQDGRAVHNYVQDESDTTDHSVYWSINTPGTGLKDFRWQISGVANMVLDKDGNLDVGGAITAASYGGITEANLVDKTAAETVSGLWSITNTSGFIVSSTTPQFHLRDTNATADEKNWIVRGDAQRFRIQTASDAAPFTGVTDLLNALRSGTGLGAVTAGGDWTWSGAGVFSTSLNAVPLARSVTATGNTATTDYGIVIRFTAGSSQTFTLDGDPPTNAVVLLDNSSGAAWTIAASTSLIWAKDATTGNRTLADDGVAVAIHRGSGTWIINGSALLT